MSSGSLLANKAITRRFSVQHYIHVCDQFDWAPVHPINEIHVSYQVVTNCSLLLCDHYCQTKYYTLVNAKSPYLNNNAVCFIGGWCQCWCEWYSRIVFLRQAHKTPFLLSHIHTGLCFLCFYFTSNAHNETPVAPMGSVTIPKTLEDADWWSLGADHWPSN